MQIPSAVAAALANTAPQKFNDLVRFYKDEDGNSAAPPTERGSRRKFSPLDLAGMHVLTSLLEAGLSQKDAGRYAAHILNKMRDRNCRDMISAHVVKTKWNETWILPYFGEDDRGRVCFNPNGRNYIVAIAVPTANIKRLVARQILLLDRLAGFAVDDLEKAMIVNEWIRLELDEQRPAKLGYSNKTKKHRFIDEEIAKLAGPLEWATLLQRSGGGWVGDEASWTPTILAQDAHVIDLREIAVEAEAYELSD